MNKIAFLTVAMSLILAGCSSNEIKELEPAELEDIEFSVELDETWRFGLGDRREHDATRFQPVIVGDQLFVADASGAVYALDKKTGRENWEVELENNITSGVSATEDKLILGTDKGELILLSQSDGQVVWTVQLSEEILSIAQAKNDLITVQTTGGRL